MTPLTISAVVGYNPIKAYSWLFSIAGEQGIEVLIRELTYRAKNAIPLSFEDYLIYFSTRLNRFENRLDATDLKILDQIAQSGKASPSHLARKVGISKEWASRKMKQLEHRKILRKFTRVPFSRINIDVYHIVLKHMYGFEKGFKLLRDCPFLYSFRKVISGPYESIGTLCVPYNETSVRKLEEGLRLLSQRGFNVDMHRINSSGVCTSFDFYNMSDGWDIPWELLGIQLRRIINDEIADMFPKVDRPQEPTQLKLDEFDMRIFDCVHKGISSLAKIRSYLNVGQERLAKRLKTLRNHNLVITKYEFHNIGLNEHVFVLLKDRAIAKALAAWTQRLPRSIISFSEGRELALMVDLPKGGSYGFASCIDGISRKSEAAVLGSSIYGNWGLPIRLWDAKYQKWKCPDEQLDRWIWQLKDA